MNTKCVQLRHSVSFRHL